MNDSFSNEEMLADLNEKSKSKKIYFLPNIFEFSVKNGDKVMDIDKAVYNFEIIENKAKEARSKGFYLEYIILLSSYIEFFLRMFICRKIPVTNPFKTRKTLGGLLQLLEGKKDDFFNTSLYKKLLDFKSFRNDTMHNLLFGFYEYNEIKNKIEDFKNLGNEIHNYVAQAIGEPFDEQKFKANLGNIIVVLK